MRWNHLQPATQDAAVIPADKNHAERPTKDDIPAPTDPRMIAAQAAAYLQPGERVIGLVRGQDARGGRQSSAGDHGCSPPGTPLVTIATASCGWRLSKWLA